VIVAPITTAAICSGSSRRLAAAGLRAHAKIGLRVLPKFGSPYLPANASLLRPSRLSFPQSQLVATSLPASFRARPAGLGWTNLAERRLRLDRLPATAAGRLFSPAAPPRAGARGPGDGFPRGRQKSLRPAVLRSAPALRHEPRVRFDRPRPVDRHRGRDRRGPTRNRRRRWRPSAASRSPRTATMPAR